MPNYCDYEMKVVGKTKKSVENIIKYLQADYNYDSENGASYFHPWRVFEANCKSGGVLKEGEKYVAYIFGCCAWSVYSCMFDGNYTYQGRNKDIPNCKGRTIDFMCRLSKVDCEIYSYECGCCFQEHFLINNKGDIEINESCDYEERYDDNGEPIYDENGDQEIIGGYYNPYQGEAPFSI